MAYRMVSIRLPNEMVQKIDNLRKENGLTRSEYCRGLILQSLDRIALRLG